MTVMFIWFSTSRESVAEENFGPAEMEMQSMQTARSYATVIPSQFGGDSVTAEHILEIMDQNQVEKAVLLQGNYYGFQNLYTHEAVKRYPDRVCWCGIL